MASYFLQDGVHSIWHFSDDQSVLGDKISYWKKCFSFVSRINSYWPNYRITLIISRLPDLFRIRPFFFRTKRTFVSCDDFRLLLQSFTLSCHVLKWNKVWACVNEALFIQDMDDTSWNGLVHSLETCSHVSASLFSLSIWGLYIHLTCLNHVSSFLFPHHPLGVMTAGDFWPQL